MSRGPGIAILLLTIGLTIGPIKAFPGVIHGTGVLTYGEWDFSESKAVNCYCGDIVVLDVFDPPLGFVVFADGTQSMILHLPDSSFQELMFAPEDTSLYDSDAPATTTGTYVVKTLEGNFAKFRFTSCSYGSMIIEYVYQPDGSRQLFNRVATKEHSWGAIKALYR